MSHQNWGLIEEKWALLEAKSGSSINYSVFKNNNKNRVIRIFASKESITKAVYLVLEILEMKALLTLPGL